MDHCKVIAVTNQKGGVGKTTTTVNLGIGLARQGKRVLMIDADPQGSLSICLGQNLRVFETEIPHSVRAAECSLSGGSIYAYDRNGKLAHAYESFTKEVEGLEERSKDRSRNDGVR